MYILIVVKNIYEKNSYTVKIINKNIYLHYIYFKNNFDVSFKKILL